MGYFYFTRHGQTIWNVENNPDHYQLTDQVLP